MNDDKELEVKTSEMRSYSPPQIVSELELEARAGSSLGLPDGVLDLGE